MAESFIEQRKRELGLTDTAAPSDGMSFAERRKIELGLVADTRPIQGPPSDVKYIDETSINEPDKADSQFRKEQVRPGRDLPVIGSVLQGLDAFSENPVVDTVASGLRSFYTPGAGLGNISGFTGAVGSGISRFAPKLAATFGGRVAQEAIKEGVVGAPLAAGQTLANGGQLDEAAQQAVIGGALGAVGGAAIPLLGRGIQSARGAAARELTQASQKQSLDTTVNEFINRTKGDAVPYVIPDNMPYPKLTDPVRSRGPQIVPKNDFTLNNPEPMNLDDLIKSKGYQEVTPGNIAQVYNSKTWYHGTGTDKLTAETLDPFVGSHESLFGQGIYLTDNPKIAEGYANSRGKRSKTPTIYETNVNVNRVLDLEKPVTPDVYSAIDNTVKPLDYQYNQHFEEPNHFTNLIRSEFEKGATPEQIITKLRKEVGDFSHEAEIPTSEFVDNFQELAINLKQAGYDAITHTGGSRTGNEAHRVLIMLDPQNWHGSTEGHGSQVTKFDKYTKSEATTGYKVDNQSIKAEPAAAETMKGNWFTNIFGNQGVGISAFSSKKRISEGPLTTADQLVKSGIKSDVQGVKDAAAAQMRSAYQNFVDYLSPLKRVSSQAYETAMDAARANNIANTIVRDKFVTPEGAVVGEGLSGIFKKVARGQDKQFIDYLTLRHAKTRMNRDERVFAETVTHNGQKMTPDVVQQRIDMYNQRHPGFDAIAKEWNQFNDNVLVHYGVNEGLISQDLYKALREKNPNYSPMRRQFSLSEKPGQRFKQAVSNSSFSGQKAPLKQVSPTGSVRDIVDPRKTTIESVGAWANAAMRNRTMQSMVDAIKRDPQAFNGVAEIVQKPQNTTDLRKVLLDGGEDDFVQALNEDFKNLFKTTRVDQENIVRAMVNGEPVYLQVHDPELVKTLIGMGPQTSNILVDVLSAFSNATKRGATGMLAPVFAVKGATMDLVQSAIQAKNPPQQALYTVHAIFSGIADKLRIPGLKNLAEEFRRAGGEYSAALKGDRKLDRGISSMTRDPLLSPKAVAKGAANLVKAPFKTLEAIGNIAENAPRMAAYKAELQRLGGVKSPDNVRQAMSQSREITVNFSRKGAFSQTLEAAIPYNNAAVQGTYRVMRAFKENPVKTSAAVAALAVVPKLAEYAMFHDDPDYLKLPARERMRFLFVNKNQDGTFTKIPMEPAYNSIGEMTIESLRYFKDNDPTAFKDSMDALANAWLPPAVSGPLQGVTQGGGLEKSITGAFNSTVAAPGVAVVANQSFTGAPIVSRAVADRSTQNQYDEKTSNIARRLGEITGMSPMKVDYLIRAYGGDPARLLLPLNSPMGAGNTRNTLLKNFIVDPQLTNTLTNDFYGGKKKLDEAYRDHKEVGAPLPPWFTDQLHKATTSTAAGSISKKLSILNDQKKAANANQSFTPEQRTVKLRDIQSKMNDIYMDINSKLYKQGVPIK